MVEEKRETVVVEGNKDHSSFGWIVALVVILVLVALFFMSGDFGMFGSGSSGGGTNVQPTTGQ
jgi:hypothetical protein